MNDANFILNGSTLVAITGLLATMSGCIAFLFRQLLKAKDEQIAGHEATIARLIAERNAALDARDHYRDETVKILNRRGQRWDDNPPRIERVPLPPPHDKPEMP